MAATSELDEIAKLGAEKENTSKSLGKQIEETSSKLKEAVAESGDIQSAIEQLEREITEARKNEAAVSSRIDSLAKKQSSLNEDKDGCAGEIEKLSDRYDEVANRIKVSSIELEAALEKANNPSGVNVPKKEFGEVAEFNRIIVVGDIHAWAPGIINVLRTNGIGNLSLLGHTLSEDSDMIRRFPDPLVAAKSGRPLPRVGLNQHPLRATTTPTMFDGLDWITGEGDAPMLMQIGDLIDRGDHGELVLEIMRMMAIQSPCSSLFMIGNHEGWIVEGDFDTWRKNEDRFRMQGRPRPGTTILDPIMTGCEDIESSMEVSFSILEGALGALLLTQHLTFIRGLDASVRDAFSKKYTIAMKALDISSSKLERALLQGGWRLHELGRQALHAWREASLNTEICIPGAFVLMTIDKHSFGHAEPNGIAHSDVDISPLQDLWSWCGHEVRVVPLILKRGRVGDNALLNARTSANEDLDEWAIQVTSGLKELVSVAGDVESYSHGHTPHDSDPCRSVIIDGKSISVINCDLGMTPIYRALRHNDQPYDPTIVPFVHEIKVQSGTISVEGEEL